MINQVWKDRIAALVREEAKRSVAMPSARPYRSHEIALADALAHLLPEVERLERIARAATAFVDEQGKIATRELLERADFATDRWEDLVAAVPEGGR